MTIGQFFYQGTSVLPFTAFVNAVDVTELKNRKAGNKDVASGTAMSLHFTAVMFAQVLGGYLRNFALKQAGYVGARPSHPRRSPRASSIYTPGGLSLSLPSRSLLPVSIILP